MDLKYKRFIPSVAKKARSCYLCKTAWNEGDKIFIMKDISNESYELICNPCGQILSRSDSTDLTEIEAELIGLQERLAAILDKIKSIKGGGH